MSSDNNELPWLRYLEFHSLAFYKIPFEDYNDDLVCVVKEVILMRTCDEGIHQLWAQVRKETADKPVKYYDEVCRFEPLEETAQDTEYVLYPEQDPYLINSSPIDMCVVLKFMTQEEYENMGEEEEQDEEPQVYIEEVF